MKAVLAAVMLAVLGACTAAHAHTTVYVEQYEIEAGWGIEPPIVDIRNDVVFRVVEPSQTQGQFTGVANAFSDMQATFTYGGASKQLDVNSDPRPGYYYSPIMPARVGSYAVVLQGEINGTPIDVRIPVEDVEPTALLAFPASGGGDSVDTAALKNAISSMQQEISSLKSGGLPAPQDVGPAYDYAVIGMSVAGAAIVLSVVAMIKRK